MSRESRASKALFCIVFHLMIFSQISAQNIISIDAKIPIPDHPVYHDDREKPTNDESHNGHDYEPLVLNIPVNGIADKIDTHFGLEKVSLSITHSRISDIKVELISPDGTLIWLTNRNGKDAQDYKDVRFTQRGFDGPISSAEPPFTGEYQPDGNLASFNNGQNPNGNWVVKIHDLAAGTEGVFEHIGLTFGDNPARLQMSPCALTNPTGCHCSRSDGRLLPDLVVSENGTAANMWEIAYDSTKGYGTLMFEVRVMNLGEGPLELVGTDVWLCGKDTVANRHVLCKEGDLTNDSIYPRQIFQQNIYTLKNGKLEKTSHEAGTMAFDAHPGHDHFHADYYARFSLLQPNEKEPDTLKWKTVGTSRKASFCLWDMQFCDSDNGKCDLKGRIFDEKNLPNYGFGTYRSCDDPKRQGISVGGIDWYGLHYDGQNLRLDPSVKNGLYYLKIEIDPFNFYEEADEKNNTLFLPVILRFQNSQ